MGNGSRNDLLRKAREDRGWTQKDLADKMDVGATTVRSWERGDRFPSVSFRAQLREIFGMTAAQLGLEPTDISKEDYQEPPPTPTRDSLPPVALPHARSVGTCKGRRNTSDTSSLQSVFLGTKTVILPFLDDRRAK